MINLTAAQLRKAANIKEKIDGLEKELGQLLGSVGTGTELPRKRRKFSAGTKAKMRAAQKARWAKIRGKAISTKPGRKPKRKFSAAGRAALSAAAKARWKKAKAAGKSRL